MIGRIIDNLRFVLRSNKEFVDDFFFLDDYFFYLDTDYGKIRVFDTGGSNPVVINVPDGPNVIEHQLPMISKLSENHRVICFEYPGIGFSYPNAKYDYSFNDGADLLLQLMDSLKVERCSLLFSCSNGFYAIQAAIKNPDRFKHLFLSQTPSIKAMYEWSKKSIPSLLKLPVLGQLTNAAFEKKLATTWYKYSLPKESRYRDSFIEKATTSLKNKGCFCLSSLVQGLMRDESILNLVETPTTMIWGSLDFTHRKTDKDSIKDHIPDCEVIEFKNCGHFPELENTKEYISLISERLE